MRAIFILATLCLCSGLPQNNLRKSSVEIDGNVPANGETLGDGLLKITFKGDRIHEVERDSSPFANSVINNIYADSRRAESSAKSANENTTVAPTSDPAGSTQSVTPNPTDSKTTTTEPTTTTPSETTTTTTEPTTTTTTGPTTTTPSETTTTTEPTTTTTTGPTTTTTTGPTTTTTTGPTTTTTTGPTTTTPSETTTTTTEPTTTTTTGPTTKSTKKPGGNSAVKIGSTSLSTFFILLLGQLTFTIKFFT